MKKYILVFIMSLTVLVLGACAEYYETKPVQGKIVEMEYDKGHWKKTTKTVDGEKKTTKKWVEEEWEITVEYNGKQKEFEFRNNKVYNQFKEGDSINLDLKIGYSDTNEVVSEHFYLPETLSNGLK